MILNTSIDDVEATESLTYHVSLSLFSLNGTYSKILTVFPQAPTEPLISGHASGTFTFVSCP